MRLIQARRNGGRAGPLNGGPWDWGWGGCDGLESVVFDKNKSDKLVRQLTAEDLYHLVECIEHALTKPHWNLVELVPILVDGHCHVPHENAIRIKAATRRLGEDELIWIAENSEKLLPE